MISFNASASFFRALFMLLVGFLGSHLLAVDRPNIVFIVVDDLGWADVAYNGSAFYETPNIDRLADEGIRFNNAYAASALCGPTRASLLTGKYPARLGITRATPQHSLPLEEFTLAEALKEGGYRTAHFGKWHLQLRDGTGPAHFPESQGFDLNVAGHESGAAASYFYPYTSAKRPENNVPSLEDGQEGDYLTDHLTDKVIEFIEMDSDAPFFVNLWFYGVHQPIQGKPEKVAKYTAKAAALGIDGAVKQLEPELGGARHNAVQNNAEYAAMVESIDDNVGRVVSALERLGLAEDTVIIFTSDNGGLSNVEVTSNLPLRAGKAWIYEGGLRVPLIFKWPARIDADKRSEVPVISTDFYPTLLELAGLKPHPEQHVDGISFKPLLSGDATELDREAIYFHMPVRHRLNTMGPVGAVRKGDYKLVQRLESPDQPELYNLSEDPGEHRDLAKQQIERTAELSRLLENWRKEMITDCCAN